MGEPIVFEHIRSWRSAGLIDDVTARRLRDAEEREGLATASATTGRLPAVAGVSAVEVLVWLGIGLVLVAWYWEVTSRAPAFGSARSAWLAVGAAIPALLTVVAGLALHARRPRGRAVSSRGDRARRGAGLLLLASGAQLGLVGYFAADLVVAADEAARLTIGALMWLAAAVLFRRLEPGSLATGGLVAAIIAVAVFGQESLGAWLFGRPDWTGETAGGLVTPGPIVPLLGVAWWLAAAAVVGLVGEAEVRSRDGGAERRAFGVRLIAGLVAVIGVASSLLATSWPTGPGATEMLDPIVGDVALLMLAAALVVLGVATHTSAWLYSAALAIVVALTDLNGRYLADALGMGLALLVEGIVLIGAGAGTELARRRLVRPAPIGEAAVGTAVGDRSDGEDPDREP